MTAAATRDTDLAALRHIAAEFEAGFNTGDVDRIMQFYGEVYVDVNLRSPVQSHAERRAYYAKVMSCGLRVSVKPDDILLHGDLALVRGSLDVQPAKGERRELRYLEVFRKGPDGKWLSVWGMDGPVQEYDPSR
jgi:ketosteroid isomerase-like protein